MSEKTEQPTPKKIRDARKKGQVATSKEVVSASLMIILFAFFLIMSDFYLEHLKIIIDMPVLFFQSPFEEAIKHVTDGIMKEIVIMLTPLLLLVIVIAIAANYIQIGALFTFDTIKPELKKISPISGIKKIFSIKNLVEFIKSTIKIVFLSYLLYKVVINSLADLLKLPFCGLDCIFPLMGVLMTQIAIYSAIAFIIIASIDYTFQKYQHIKQLKMSKDEVKQEYKESEGDPLIKSKRKQFHQEIMMNNMLNNVKRSSVVVTNPTRIAIAILYDEESTPLPVIMAKGENLIARRIIEIAKEEGIPIMENVPLARSLHEQAKIDEFIPSDLLEAVAEVLQWIKQIDNN